MNTGRVAASTTYNEGSNLLFEYGVKFLLLAGFLELVLYRLVSRLGMHLSKLSEQYEFVRTTFRVLSSLGFVLLNVTSLLLFLVLFVLLIQKVRPTIWFGKFDAFLVPSVSVLILLTVTYLVFPPAMLGSVLYNVVSLLVLLVLAAEFMLTHHLWIQRATIGCFVLGIGSWIYYQTVTASYGLLGVVDAPPFVHEVNRLGESFMVLASILVFWAFGSTSLFTKNKQQKRWAYSLLLSGGMVFVTLIFFDYLVYLYDPTLAEDIRKAGQGIGWIFQMGMGYTFYLPFAFYMIGFICWAYTVIKLILIGRLAGYGIGLMFMAGYALQLSHLTLMVMAGLLLLNVDKRGTFGKLRNRVQENAVYASRVAPMLGEAR